MHLHECRYVRSPHIIREIATVAHGFMLVYSVTDRHSFESIQEWNDVVEKAPSRFNKSLAIRPTMLLGNRVELRKQRPSNDSSPSERNEKLHISYSYEDEWVSYEEGRNLADRCGMSFFETSAKTGSNVEAAFTEMCRQSLQYWRQVVGEAKEETEVEVDHGSEPATKETKISQCSCL